jgi:hypothetical protein
MLAPRSEPQKKRVQEQEQEQPDLAPRRSLRSEMLLLLNLLLHSGFFSVAGVRALAVIAVLLCCTVARAQSTGIAADRFVPGVGPATLVGGEGAEVTPPKQVALALSLGGVRDPLKLVLRDGSLLSRPVRWQLATDLAAETGVWRRIAVGVGLPVVWWAAGDRLRGTGVDDAPLGSPRAGDLRLRAKATLVGDPTARGLHLAALVQVTIPLGGEHDFAATDGVTVEPRVIADVRLPRVALAAALGVRFAPERKLFQTSFGDELTWTVGAIVLALERRVRLHFIVEGAGAVGSSVGTRPVELRGAARLGVRWFSLDLGAGAGVDADAGAPSWRVFAVARALVPGVH